MDAAAKEIWKELASNKMQLQRLILSCLDVFEALQRMGMLFCFPSAKCYCCDLLLWRFFFFWVL